MSAIVGIETFNNKPIKSIELKTWLNTYQNFPADNIQTWQKDNIFLGCHFQWITPESIGETLPYFDYHRQIAITADAIIDNREELLDRLQVEKSQWRSIPDSQIILLAYSKWGEKAPKYLIGDFAFMIWDEKQKKFFGARDFSGARTLYYFHDSAQFAFSTLIEPLFSLQNVKKSLNEEWLAEFLAIPNMVESVDMNTTVYKNIKQVPPSHSISVKNGKVALTRYCTIEVTEKLKLKSNEEYEEAFREVLQKAVTDRLRTFGKVGSHLSGGLDSGSIVSFAARELKKSNKTLHTFSYIPEEGFIDWTDKYYLPNEKPYIKETVKHVGNIIDQYLSFSRESPLDVIDDFLNVMEMPYKFFENAFWLNGINQEAQKKGIKVLLNGARGNHSISWGSMNLTYNYYVSLLKKAKWVQLYNELDDYCKNFKTGKSVMIPFIFKRAFTSFKSKTNNANSNLSDFLINPHLASKTKVFDKLKDFGLDVYGSPIKDVNQYRKNYYQHLYVWNKSGVANTKMSLRYSLWDRDPTNDIRVIRFCLSVPDEQYTTKGFERSLIRRATENYLPNSVRLNQSHRGIQGADTIHRMTKNWGVFIEEVNTLLNDSVMSSLVNTRVLNEAVLKLEKEPKPEMVFEENFRIVVRSLIVYRFLKRVV
ncbi:asparagine synthase-related protein [Metabacillus halosaccharovorans]|uniref:asparagine synthase (glutamine-hydrolyzing) n=1 Tax=Metabacillus halosaccharovorans TaxID=930124 RepID=A0ABT3DNG7_9BACI|nr:asparagine synthase-related protein [Metabacillus halosaccharovorans]MCV9888147.1 asparagine synthase-related protein [Metabacillus halosaccharovorans]